MAIKDDHTTGHATGAGSAGSARFDNIGRGPAREPAPRLASLPRVYAPEPPAVRFDLNPATRIRDLQPFVVQDRVPDKPQSGQQTLQAMTDSTKFQADTMKLPTPEQPTYAPHTVRRRSYDLTDEQYAHLTDQQRKAVDFNTLLVDARNKDLSAHYAEDPAKRAQYDQALEKMFGKQSGSSGTFAPETLAVLQQIGYKPEKGENLDQLLSLRDGITADQIQTLTPDHQAQDLVATMVGGVVGKRNDVASELERFNITGDTGRMEKALASSNQLMSSLTNSSAASRASAVEFLGGQPDKVTPEQGFGAPVTPDGAHHTIDYAFRQWYDELAQKGVDSNKVWGEVGSVLKPNELQSFMNYADTRSSQADQYGLPLGETKGAHYRTADEFRQILGLGGAK